MWNRYVAVLLLSVLFVNKIGAQDAAKDFSDKRAVIDNFEEELVISFNKKGELEATTTVIQQTKIQKPTGMNLAADKDVYHSFFSELKDVKAYTLKPGRGKKVPIIKKETKNDRSSYVFYEDGKITTLYYGELEPEASTYVKYELHHKDIHIIPSKFVQYYLPIKRFVYRVVTPANLDIRFIKKFYDSKYVSYTKEEKRSTIIHTFTGTDIPAFKSIDYAPPIKYYMPHIIPIIEGYTNKKQNKRVYVNKDPKALYQYYSGYMDKANGDTDEELVKRAAEIVKGKTTDREKAKAIFDWVKTKIRYVAFEDGYGGFVPRLAKDVCNKRYGDCKDMATLLVHLLRSQNLNAYHTWIGTRRIPYSYAEVPSTTSDNHMICGLYLDNEWIMLDATASYLPFGYTPDNLQGKEALIGINKDSFVVRPLPMARADQNVITDTTWIEIKDKSVLGKIHLQIKGYKALEIKTYLSYKDTKDKEDYIKKYLYRGNNKCILNNVKWEHTQEDAIDVTADFELDNYMQLVGDDIYINTVLTKYFSGFRFKDDRKFKVDNEWASRSHFVTYLQVPDDYQIRYKPSDYSKKVNSHYTVNLKCTQADQQLVTQLNVQYDLLDIEPKHIADHNSLVADLEKNYKEIVHLKKIENE